MLCAAIAVLEATPAFGSAPVGSAAGIGLRAAGPLRTLTEAFVRTLCQAARRQVAVRSAAGAGVTATTAKRVEDDLAEAVARRLANTDVSRYDCAAATDWPSLAAQCPGLRARFHLAPSGLVHYSVGPSSEDPAGGTAAWGLSGEGLWRVLPEDGEPTEVVLQMCQGLTGQGPPRAPTQEARGANDGACALGMGPFVLRVDLRRCVRVIDVGADEEEEEGNDEEDTD